MPKAAFRFHIQAPTVSVEVDGEEKEEPVAAAMQDEAPPPPATVGADDDVKPPGSPQASVAGGGPAPASMGTIAPAGKEPSQDNDLPDLEEASLPKLPSCSTRSRPKGSADKETKQQEDPKKKGKKKKVEDASARPFQPAQPAGTPAQQSSRRTELHLATWRANDHRRQCRQSACGPRAGGVGGQHGIRPARGQGHARWHDQGLRPRAS